MFVHLILHVVLLVEISVKLFDLLLMLLLLHLLDCLYSLHFLVLFVLLQLLHVLLSLVALFDLFNTSFLVLDVCGQTVVSTGLLKDCFVRFHGVNFA